MTKYIDWDGEGAQEDSPALRESILTSFSEHVRRYDYEKHENVYEPEAWRVGDPDLTAEEFEPIVAAYTYEDYSGQAYVLYRDLRDGLLYEQGGGHCSCYGLEGQWDDPAAREPVSPEALLAKAEDPEYHFWGYAFSGGADKEVDRKIREAIRSEIGRGA